MSSTIFLRTKTAVFVGGIIGYRLIVHDQGMITCYPLEVVYRSISVDIGTLCIQTSKSKGQEAIYEENSSNGHHQACSTPVYDEIPSH